MAFIEWNDSYRIGISRIDEQHKKLIEMMDKLAGAMHEKKTSEVLEEIIDGLIDYAKYHFSTEEELFRKYDYPDYETHKKIHDGFVEKVKKFKEDLINGKLLLSVEVMMFMRDWLVNHILGTDKKYVPFLKDKGVE